MTQKTSTPVGVKRHLLAASAVIILFIAFGAFLFYVSVSSNVSATNEGNLKAIADLKVGQLTQWRIERVANAHVNSRSPIFLTVVEEWLAHPADIILRDKLKKQLLLPKTEYGYEDIFIASCEGAMLLSVDSSMARLDSSTASIIRSAALNAEVTLSDFYFSSANRINFDIIAPIRNLRNRTIAVLVFRSNPDKYLYPLIQSWPTSSRSSETLILRKDGDSVLYLNELRFQKNSALRFRKSLNEKTIPAVQAVLGRKGIFEGRDYQGAQVFAYIAPVPNTSWFLVAQVAHSEIFAELYYRTALLGIISIIAILLLGAGVELYYRSRQTAMYQALFVKEKELREYHEEFKSILYSIGDGIITTNLAGRVKQLNPAATMLTGWNETDAKGKHVDEVVTILDEETRTLIENPFLKVLHTGINVALGGQTLLVSKGGKQTPVSSGGAPIRDNDSEITGALLVLHDRTDEHEAEVKWRKSEQSYRSLVNSIPDTSVLLFDSDLRFQIAGGGELEKANVAKSKIEGKTLREAFPKNMADTFEPIYTKALNGEPTVFEMAYEDLVYSLQIVPIEDDNGIVFGAMQIAINITERKRKEQELREKNTELERFTYTVSHDLKSPLITIKGFSGGLMKDLSLGRLDRFESDLKRIDDAADKMSGLLDDLLELSRVGRIVNPLGDLALGTLVLDVVSLLSGPIAGKKATVVVQEGLPVVRADRRRLFEVLQNLIENALKYMGDQSFPRVEIGMRADGGERIFFVRDNGMGFDPRYNETIFGLFNKLDASTQGTGIGLALVRRIIEVHGGRVWAESDGIGCGAIFYFTLPSS